MGQAKQRGTKEDRIKKAVDSYHDKLKKLSKYGLTVEVLNEYFKGNEALVVYYIQQIASILNTHDDVVNVRLFIKNEELGLDVETTGVNRDIGEQEQDLTDALNAIDASSKPESMVYGIFFANTTKDKVDEVYIQETDKSFDLTIGQDRDYFYKLVSDNLAGTEKAELDYYAEILNLYSNHPFSADKSQSYFFKTA